MRNIACNTNKCCKEASTVVLIDVLKFAEAVLNASSSSRLVLVSSPPHERSASAGTHLFCHLRVMQTVLC